MLNSQAVEPPNLCTLDIGGRHVLLIKPPHLLSIAPLHPGTELPQSHPTSLGWEREEGHFKERHTLRGHSVLLPTSLSLVSITLTHPQGRKEFALLD